MEKRKRKILKACLIIVFKNNFEKWFLKIVFKNYCLIFVEQKFV